MFQEYKQYIENIRNNLIQNNVNLDIVDIEDYRSLFMYTYTLEQILWFYRMLGISGSQFRVQSKYIYDEVEEEKVRQIAYKDFIDFLDDYRSLSAKYYRLQKLQKENSSEDYIDIDEDEEIFLDEELTEAEEKEISKEEEKTSSDFLKFLQNSLPKEENVVNLYQSQGVEYVSHGIYIDEYGKAGKSLESDRVEVDSNYNNDNETTSNGIFIDEWKKPGGWGSCSLVLKWAKDVKSGVTNDEDYDGIEYVEEMGIEEDDAVIDEDEYENEYDGVEYVELQENQGYDEDDPYQDNLSEESEEFNDGLEYVDEDEFQNYSDEDELDEWLSDDGLEYVETDEEIEDDGIEYVDEEDGIEFEDEDDGIEYVDEPENEYPETQEADSNEGEIYKSTESEGNNLSGSSVSPVETKRSVEKKTVTATNRDISDSMLEVTNKVINQGIRMVSKAFKS